MTNLSELINAFDKIISRAVAVQCLILGLSAAVILTFVNIKNTESTRKVIDGEFRQVEGQITQALFVQESISASRLSGQYNLPGLDFFKQNLVRRDIRAEVSLAPCEPVVHVKSHIIYRLDIGTRKLNTCVVVDTSRHIDMRITIQVILTLALSLGVMLLFWLIFKKQLATKYISPVVKELDEMNRVFIAGKISRQVAHDIRSPLSALQIASKSINSRPADAVRLIQMTIERIERIVDELLVGSPGSKLILHKKNSGQSSVNDIVKEIVQEKQAEYAHNKNIVISEVIDENRRALINTASIDLKRILSNLVNNSVEATNGGLNKIQITTLISRDQTLISVRDTGAGIENALLERLNDSNSVNKNLTTKTKGNGLGLSWCKSAIHKFGGQIHVKSKPGAGCIIDVKLPTVQLI